MSLLVGAVDQVEGVGLVTQRPLQSLNGLLDLGQPQAGGTKRGEHIGIGQGLDQFHRGNAVGHGTGHIRVADSVIDAKLAITQRGDILRRHIGQQEVTFGIASIELNTPTGRKLRLGLASQQAKRPGNLPQGLG